MTQPTLYDRLGGEGAMLAAVDLFYAKVLADPVTSRFFAGLDMNAQIAKQVGFMTRVFGGPVGQQGRDLQVAHARLVHEEGLGAVHFDAVATHLGDTLRELGVDPALITEVMTLVGGTRAAVLQG